MFELIRQHFQAAADSLNALADQPDNADLLADALAKLHELELALSENNDDPIFGTALLVLPSTTHLASETPHMLFYLGFDTTVEALRFNADHYGKLAKRTAA